MRIKWLQANITIEKLSIIKAYLLENDYQEGQLEGFRLETVASDSLQGKYIFKRNELHSLIDPFGMEYTYETIEYEIFSFKLSSVYPQITVFNPPRSITIFLNNIAKAIEDILTITAIEVNLTKWLNNLEMASSSIVVKKIFTSGIMLSASTSAKYSVVGTEDVRKYLDIIPHKYAYQFDKVHVALDDGSVDCVMTKTGSATFSGKNVSEFHVAQVAKTLAK